MIIAIAGFNGYLGRKFVGDRKEDKLIRLSRDLLYGEISLLSEAIKGAEVIVNLAGSPINVRWTSRNRKKIEESREGVNRRLVEAVNQLEKKPELMITASAIGIYKTGETHTEAQHQVADNYLSKVVRMWEAPLEGLSPDVSAVRLRIGVVLGRKSSAFKPFLLASRLGIIPVLGSGKQALSFIHPEDLIAAMRFIINGGREGIYHLCVPHPVNYTTFARSLAKATGKKWIIRIPVFMFKLVLGEAHMMVSEGPCVLPERLLEEGFRFRFPDVDSVLINLLNKH
ncbi:MAG: DUF1731 domain-containing protein [Bacteroidales bacterium]